jgi:hypothetical protein
MEESVALDKHFNIARQHAGPNPDIARLAFETAEYLFSENRLGDALEYYRLAQIKGLDNDEGLARRWLCSMMLGRFEEAWRETDRSERKRLARNELQDQLPFHLRRVWNGQALDRKRVLVRCYHGLGDTLQFIRYAELLKPRAHEVIVQCEPRLMDVLEQVKGIDELIPLNGAAEAEVDYDVDAELMELPYAFRTELNTIPARVPYVALPDGIVKQKRAELTILGLDDQQLNVGVCWASGGWDRTRDIPHHCLTALIGLPGVQLFSLQKGCSQDQVNSGHVRLRKAEKREGTLCETAAAIACLDLVISVDTMIAHLAGALAKPVWTLLPYSADWRWMIRTSRSPWYPTMRLFRQPRPGHWVSVIDNVAHELRAAAYARLRVGRGTNSEARYSQPPPKA